MAKYLKLRRDDACVACGVDLEVGTAAYGIASERTVRCVRCHEGTDHKTAEPAVVEPPTVGSAESMEGQAAAAASADRDTAGRSAQSEYEKRSAKERARKQKRVEEDAEWRTSIKEKRPVLGRIASALTPKPEVGPESQATKAWKTGAEGERRVAEVLAEAVGIEVLHDRRAPGSKANIDHIAVGPAGVFVIDAKKYTGQVEVAMSVGCSARTSGCTSTTATAPSSSMASSARSKSCEPRSVTSSPCRRARRALLRWLRVGMVHAPEAHQRSHRALADHVSATGEHVDQVRVIADHLRLKLRPAT